jgi:hypothetical protein
MMTIIHSELLGALWEQDENIWATTSDAEIEHVFEVQQVFVRAHHAC